MKQIPELRDYQNLAVGSIREAWSRKIRNILLTAPARSGKTTIFSYITKCAETHSRACIQKYIDSQREYTEPRHILIVAARRELIQQASDRIAQYGIKHGIIMAGDSRSRPNLIVQVASIQTLRRRPEWIGKFKLIIIDECHASSSASYQWLIDQNPAAYLLGFTATPFRTDNKPLGKIYGEMIKISTVNALIERGYLVPYRVFCPHIPDTSGLKADKDGNFDTVAATALMDKPALIGDIVSEWKKHCSDRQTICYASSVQHSLHIVEAFKAAGMRAEHIDATTPKDRRKKLLEWIEDGTIQIISNVGILTEGVDIPSVSCVIFARLTDSRVLYIQACSRGMGAYDMQYQHAVKYGLKQNMVLLDHAGVTHKYGLLYDQEIDELSRDEKTKPTDLIAEERLRQCPECYCCHEFSAVCPECGHIYEASPRAIEHIDGEMRELDMEAFKKNRADEVKKARTLEDLQKIEQERGYKEGWAKNKLKFRKQTREKAIAAYQYDRWGKG